MTTKSKAPENQGLQQHTGAKPVVKRTPADAKPERSSEIFSRLIRSIDSNLSIAHQFAGEAKKRLG